VFKLMWEQTQMVLRWVAWAEQEVAEWPSDASRPASLGVADVLGEAAATG
jgi:hypothetical protein